jgi:hypothetical protein
MLCQVARLCRSTPHAAPHELLHAGIGLVHAWHLAFLTGAQALAVDSSPNCAWHMRDEAGIFS